MQALVAGFAIVVFAVAAFGDIKRRRIPNGLVLIVGGLGIARLSLTGDPGAAAMTLIAATVVLAIGFLLFLVGFIGGGDAKLLAGATLLVGYQDLFGFLFLMSLCGGVLAVAVLAQHRIRRWFDAFVLWIGAQQKPGGWITRHRRASAALAFAAAGDQSGLPLSVPYGVAIAAAGIITLGLQTLPPQLLL